MTPDVTMKRNDTGPQLVVQVVTNKGEVVSLVDATLPRFHMWTGRTRNMVVDAAATIVSAEQGLLAYDWLPADTDVIGLHEAEFQVTLSNSDIVTVPNSRNLRIDFVTEIEVGEPSAYTDAVVLLRVKDLPDNYLPGDVWDNAGTGGATYDATPGTTNVLYNSIIPQPVPPENTAYPAFLISPTTTRDYPARLADVGFSVGGTIWGWTLGQERTFLLRVVPLEIDDAKQRFMWFFNLASLLATDEGWEMSIRNKAQLSITTQTVTALDLTDDLSADMALETTPALPGALPRVFYAMIVRVTATTISFYINGKLISSQQLGAFSGISGVGPLCLGAPMIVRDLVAWNRALTAQEIVDVSVNG